MCENVIYAVMEPSTFIYDFFLKYMLISDQYAKLD